MKILDKIFRKNENVNKQEVTQNRVLKSYSEQKSCLYQCKKLLDEQCLEIYEPVMFEQWLLLKELQSGKYVSYNDYLQQLNDRKQNYLSGLSEDKFTVGIENFIHRFRNYLIDDLDIQREIEFTNNQISNIENKPNFIKWNNENQINEFRNFYRDENYKNQYYEI